MEALKSLVIVTLVTLGVGGCGGGERQISHEAPDTASTTGAATAVAQTDACQLVTEDDASALFGQPATLDSGPSAFGMIAQCLWTWDTPTSNQLLQFQIWDQVAYDRPEDAEALDLGEEGYVRAHPMAGVDITWVQDGRTISLSYSTLGPEAPVATSKVEEVKALARTVAGRL